jgi:hypothetical protein
MIKPSRITFIAAFSALASLSLISSSSNAQEDSQESDLSVGRGFICNTEDEVEAAVTSDDDATIKASLASVNDRFGKDSCTFATAVFDGADEGKDVTTSRGTVRVQKMILLGYLVGNDFVPIAEPKAQFFGVLEKDAGV